MKPGKPGEKRRANADAISGNAPIKNAARTPSSKPKIILRAFGRMTRTRPLSTPAAVPRHFRRILLRVQRHQVGVRANMRHMWG